MHIHIYTHTFITGDAWNENDHFSFSVSTEQTLISLFRLVLGHSLLHGPAQCPRSEGRDLLVCESSSWNSWPSEVYMAFHYIYANFVWGQEWQWKSTLSQIKGAFELTFWMDFISGQDRPCPSPFSTPLGRGFCFKSIFSFGVWCWNALLLVLKHGGDSVIL